jgi:hypothetical protein
MKNIIFWTLAVSILIVSCDDTDINPSNPDNLKEETLFSITVPDGIYTTPPNLEEFIYATNEDGDLIASAALSNNATFDLKAFYDIANKSYDITHLAKYESNGVTNYSIYTFPKASYGHYTKEKYIFNTAEKQAIIRIENTGSNPEIEGLSGAGIRSSNDNGGWIEVEYNLQEIPDNMYLSIRGGGDTDWKYIWLEDIYENDQDTLQYSALPVLSLANSTTVDLPSNDNLSYKIAGFTSSTSLRRYIITDIHENQEVNSVVQNIPSGLFSMFERNVILINGDKFYRTKERKSSVSNSYSLPILDYEVLDTSVANFEMTSNSIYDYYSIYFERANQDYTVTWSFEGKGESTVNVRFPNLVNEIFTEHPNFSISDLSYMSERIKTTEGLEKFEDYVGYSIFGGSYYYLLTKLETLIKL